MADVADRTDRSISAARWPVDLLVLLQHDQHVAPVGDDDVLGSGQWRDDRRTVLLTASADRCRRR